MRFLIIVLCAAACSTPPAALRTESAPSDLSGIWRVAFVSDSGGHRTGGVIALFESRILGERFGFQPVPGVTQGTYDVDFRPLGFTFLGGAALQPAASALRGDSVEVVLNPYVGHGRLIMQGVRRGGIVSGDWSYDGPGGARGGFELRPWATVR